MDKKEKIESGKPGDEKGEEKYESFFEIDEDDDWEENLEEEEVEEKIREHKLKSIKEKRRMGDKGESSKKRKY